MNTPKYRIRDKEKKCFFVPTYEAYRGVLEELLMNQDGTLALRTMDGMTHESVFPDRFVVMRRTWRIDCNWVAIRGGDIVKVEDFYSTHKCENCWYAKDWIWIWVIEYDVDEQRYGYKLWYNIYQIYDIEKVEVIGNIRDNPDLLSTP